MAENGQITADQIRMKIKELVASVTEREPEEIPDNVGFRDLGVDSLLVMELMLAIDKKFKIDIPEEEFEKLLTVDDTVPVVERYLAETSVVSA